MTNADRIFVQTLKDILASPYSDEGLEVRPKWTDGTPAHTRKIFGVCHTYDLRKEFPIITTRRCFWKSAFQEVLWIYQKKSANIHDLGSHIWDSWADDNGSIGKAYGYQIAQKTMYKEGPMDQMERVFYDLKNNPTSRSIITTTYNMQDLPEMHLRPCAYSMTYNVTRDDETGEMILNGLLNQRSQDMITANNWNTVQYALLLMCIANEVGMTPGVLTHVIADCHIYDRHEDIARDIIARAENEPNDFGAPTVLIDRVPFDQLTADNVHVLNYQFDTTDYAIEVAV